MRLVCNYYIYVLVDGARLAVTWVAAQVFLLYCVIFILYRGQAKYLHSSAGRASPCKIRTLPPYKTSKGSSPGLFFFFFLRRCMWPLTCHYTIRWYHGEVESKIFWRCIFTCVCSHHVSGAADSSTQRRGRESLPSRALMSGLISCRTRKTREGKGKNFLFERVALVLVRGFSHYMQNCNCASWDCVNFKLIKAGETSMFFQT